MGAASAPPGPTLSVTAVPAPLPSSTAFTPGPLAAGLLLAALAAAVLVMARRRRRTSRLVEILESASLGPKRALVVARLGDEILVLGSSEGGVALLSTRPAAGLVSDSSGAGARAAFQDGALPGAAFPSPPPDRAPRGTVLDLLSRLRPRSRAAPAFDAVLTESLEDVELRRKLEAGLAAQVGSPAYRSIP
jgi:flagellar biogenesis protein FliO